MYLLLNMFKLHSYHWLHIMGVNVYKCDSVHSCTDTCTYMCSLVVGA